MKEIHGAACSCPWHCHVEFELILTLQSQGYRIVGDNLRSLQPGDMVLLGPNLPHAFQHTDRLPARSTPVRCVLLQFEGRLWANLFELPAMAAVGRLLRRASQGLQIAGATRKQVAAMLFEMLKLRGPQRIAVFLTALDVLARSRTCQAIASPGGAAALSLHEQERIGRVCQFIDENAHRPLRIGEAAKIAHMSEGAFSRFFRSHIGKTFPTFLNDLRIGRACRLLAETDMNVTEIALACGYQNMSNFNRQFLRIRGESPSEFRRRIRRPR